MGTYEFYLKQKEEIKSKLSKVKLAAREETRACWLVGNLLKVSGTTVKNYLDGKISDGYLAEAIYKEFKKLKLIK